MPKRKNECLKNKDPSPGCEKRRGDDDAGS